MTSRFKGGKNLRPWGRKEGYCLSRLLQGVQGSMGYNFKSPRALENLTFDWKYLRDTSNQTDQLISFILAVMKSHPKLTSSMAEKIGMSYDDLVDDIEIHIWSELANYNQSREALTSFIYRAVGWFICEGLRYTELRQRRIPQ
jgi:hypothetical protein